MIKRLKGLKAKNHKKLNKDAKSLESFKGKKRNVYKV